METNAEKLYVIKIGGNVIDNPAELSRFLDTLAAVDAPKILIHGGGKLASSLSTRLGIEPQMVDGRRITDEETLRIVTMVYAGWINKSIVAGLQARNNNAIGFCGADADLIRAHKRTNSSIDYGFVGDIDRVDGERLAALIGSGLVPIFAPITHDGNGLLLNTNADTVASKIAVALSEFFQTELVYCFEKAGVLTDVNDDSSLISNLTLAKYEVLKADGTISAGMLPKLENAFAALAQGVGAVTITHAQKLPKPNAPQGTRITHS